MREKGEKERKLERGDVLNTVHNKGNREKEKVEIESE